MPEWTIVVPVKGTASAKSRLGGSPELALAIALDTVAAALEVAPVIVVTPLAEPFVVLGATVVADGRSGLSAAIRQGVNAAGDGAVAVLLGDFPAMQPAELGSALAAAGRHPLAFVPDADGTGTVLVTALRAADHAPAFGPGSAALHRAAGYVELDVPVSAGLRRDVDTPADLAALGDRLGERTRSSSVES